MPCIVSCRWHWSGHQGSQVWGGVAWRTKGRELFRRRKEIFRGRQKSSDRSWLPTVETGKGIKQFLMLVPCTCEKTCEVCEIWDHNEDWRSTVGRTTCFQYYIWWVWFILTFFFLQCIALPWVIFFAFWMEKVFVHGYFGWTICAL